MILFGKEVFANEIKSRDEVLSWIVGLALNPMTSLLTRATQKKRPCEDGDRDWSNTVISQGILEPPEAGRGKKQFFLSAFSGQGPY